MWIRNQDKKCLVNSKMFKVEKNAVLILTEDYAEGEWYLAGEYETEERAVEVLDSIQDQLTNFSDTKTSEIYSSSGWLSTEERETVFQMPEK